MTGLTVAEHSILVYLKDSMLACKNDADKRNQLINIALSKQDYHTNERSIAFVESVHRFVNLKNDEVADVVKQLRKDLL